MSDVPPTPKEALIEAKPPTTDYWTYLTIIEYNLSKDVLLTLSDILQNDPTLTINIGWDLVQLLIPLLPESQECLQIIARSGNPREVVLKVTEALRLLHFDLPEDEEVSDDDDDEDLAVAGVQMSLRDRPGPSYDSNKEPRPIDLVILQFQALVAMLAVLHARIKTKYPSRFLATSLQAVLVAYQRAGSSTTLLTDSILAFVKALSGSKRPHLPPRTSSGNILATATRGSAPDPEASSEVAGSEEAAIQTRLLQSFITHVLEDYMLSLKSSDDVPGLAWCSRYMEKVAPERKPDVPGRVPFAERFASEEQLIERSSTIGQIVAIARDLKLLGNPELLKLCLDKEAESTGQPQHEDEPPNSVEDIPLSKTGALFLVAAGFARQALFDTGGQLNPMTIFPEHETILTNYVDAMGNAVMVSDALIDALLFLALVSLEHNKIGEPEDDEHFTKYLQSTSLLSAECPSPTLRYHAHYVTSTVLRSHPSDIVRLAFIRDTLEHCPYENLKATAVGWLKGETIEANLTPLMQAQGQDAPTSEDDHEHNIFSTPVALATLAPYLFYDITPETGPEIPVSDAWLHFKTNLTFYLTTLNFCYFLLKAQPLHNALDIKELYQDRDVSGSYLGSLRSVVERFDKELKGGQLKEEEGDNAEAICAELNIFIELMENIAKEVAKQGQ